MSELEELHHDLLTTLKLDRLEAASLVLWNEPVAKVADNPSKSFLIDSAGKPVAFLSVANPLNPDLVERSVRKSREAKQLLGERLGRVVLEPYTAGDFRELSFAVWPLRRNLSSHRIVRAIQKRLITRPALQWLELGTRQTLVRDLDQELRDQSYVVPLTRLREQDRCPERIQRLTAQTLERCRDGSLPLVSVLQHSDLWLGNFLLPLGRTLTPAGDDSFCIIDWAGSARHGYPFFDLITFSDSVRLNGARLRREIDRHCKTVGCKPDVIVNYVVCALAAIRMNLEHFDESRFLETCDRLLDRIPDAN